MENPLILTPLFLTNLTGGNNLNTKVLCNSWKENNFETAIDIVYNTQLIGAWGSKAKGSGNVNSNIDHPMSHPAMNYETGGLGMPIINYFELGELDQIFSYSGLISGVGFPDLAHGCTLTLAPLVIPIGIDSWSESGDDLEKLETEYSINDSILVVYNNQLPRLSGADAKSKTHQIEQLNIDQDDIVRRALSAAQEKDMGDINTWLQRASPKLLNLSAFFSMWYSGEFIDLSTELILLNNDDATTLKDASDYMNTIVTEDRSIYELSNTQVDTLAEIAQASFGNYTNLLRTFLNSEYDKLIIRPDSIEPRSSKSNSYADEEISASDKKYTIVPNPSKGCISILNSIDKNASFDVIVYNSLGSIIEKHALVLSRSNICLNETKPGIYWVRIYDSSTGYNESHKLILN